MKTVLEQLMELQEQVDSLKAHFRNTESFKVEPDPICDGFEGCGCGCDEPPVEVEDEGPEFDSAGFSIEDREVSAEEAQVIVFTREELITFAAELADRVISKCKEAVTDTNIDAEDVVELSMGYGYQIEMELDQDSIVRSIHDEIDNTIETDNDSIEDEVNDILRTMNEN
jgi:hypothetical protein